MISLDLPPKEREITFLWSDLRSTIRQARNLRDKNIRRGTCSAEEGKIGFQQSVIKARNVARPRITELQREIIGRGPFPGRGWHNLFAIQPVLPVQLEHLREVNGIDPGYIMKVLGLTSEALPMEGAGGYVPLTDQLRRYCRLIDQRLQIFLEPLGARGSANPQLFFDSITSDGQITVAELMVEKDMQLADLLQAGGDWYVPVNMEAAREWLASSLLAHQEMLVITMGYHLWHQFTPLPE